MKSAVQTMTSQLSRLAAGTGFWHNVLEAYGTRLLVVCISFATAVVISRVLGPTGRGFYAVAMTVGAIGVQFGNMGLHASNTYHVAKDRSLLPALVGNTLAVTLCATVAAIAAGLVFSVWPDIAPIHGTLLLLALASVPIGLAYLLLQNLLLGVDDIRTYNKVEASGKLLALLVMCSLALAGVFSVELFFAVTLSCAFVSFCWVFSRLRTILTDPLSLSISVFRRSMGIGMRAYLIAFFGFLVLRVDLLMVKYLLGPTEAGFYSISQVLSENTMMFPVVLGMLLFPKLSGTKDRRQRLKLAHKAVMATAALMLPMIAAAALLAKPLITAAFGQNFLPAVGPFIWLTPGIFFLGLETVMVQLLNSEGFPLIIVIAWVVDTIINVGTNLWAIPHYGITGASIVSSVCYFLMFLIVTWAVWSSSYTSGLPGIAD
jgi:O-antigen/teichoic acid export membrane protein